MYSRLFARSVRIKNSAVRTQITVLCVLRLKRNSLINCHKMTIFQLVLSDCSVNNRKVVTIKTLMQLLIVPYYTIHHAIHYASSMDKSRHSVVIRNLKYDQTESTDSNITKNKVNRLIRDGLKLTDIEILTSERKQTRDGRPGIIIVTFATAEQKSSVMKQKKDLRKNKNYESVYLEDERPPGQRLNESNMRTLLKACGKSGDYIFSNGRLFQKRKQQQ